MGFFSCELVSIFNLRIASFLQSFHAARLCLLPSTSARRREMPTSYSQLHFDPSHFCSFFMESANFPRSRVCRSATERRTDDKFILSCDCSGERVSPRQF